MEMDKVQRLMLVNQYRILALLDPEQADYYNRAATVIESGYQITLTDPFRHLSDPMSEDDCRLVYRILTMYTTLQQSYEALEDKAGLEPSDVVFRGFDGNNEGEYLGYARFLMEQEDKYGHLKLVGKSLNSHAPVLPGYRRMVAVWEPMQKALKVDGELTAEQIRTILDARRAP
jgi:uncharacterized protein